MNITNIRIGQRLTIGFGLVIGLLVMLAGLALARINSLSGELNALVQVTYPRTELANRMKADLNEVSRGLLSTLVMSDEGQVKEEVARIVRFSKDNDERLAELQKLVTEPEDLQLLEQITSR